MVGFRILTVSEKTVLKAMKKMKNKKSSGKDGVSQECRLLGSEVLAIPLTRINKKIHTAVWAKHV